MATLKATTPISHILSNVTMTVTITGLTKWRFQVWVATRLIGLAALVLNMNIDIQGIKVGK